MKTENNGGSNRKVIRAVLTDLSKAFDCVCHNLLMAKLNACDLSLSALNLVHNYLQKPKQKTRMASPIAYGKKLYLEQGPILGLLLLNIFLCDLFLSSESNYFTNYADDTTPYANGSDAEEVVSQLKTITEKLYLVSQNEMKANIDKCHLPFAS